MQRFEGINEGPLGIERRDGDGVIGLVFTGKSILRDPMELLQPILIQVLEEADSAGARLRLDFSHVRYMNSSTFTPLVKLLERARSGGSKVEVVYDATQKWQSVSFTALMIFDTGDGRVAISGGG